jgi:type IV secretory pathway VirB4 component
MVQAPTFRMLDAWQATLPAACDRIGQTRVLDTAALAACAPLTSPDNSGPGVSPTAVLAGVSTATGAPVFRDRWAETNHNSLILGTSGAGKSFLAKTDLTRELCTGTLCTVIDPEGEYAPLAHAVGGTVVHLGLPGNPLNILDLPTPEAAGPCELATRVLDLHTLAAVLIGSQHTERLRPALDRAAISAYQQAGITEDPTTWNRPAPDLADIATEAASAQDSSSHELATCLEPYATGSFAALFNRNHSDATSTADTRTDKGEAPLTVYTLQHLPDALRTPAILLVLSACWRQAQPADQRRLLLIDEAWQLLQDPAAARFVYRIAKSARKHRLALSLVTQDSGDLLASELGTAIASNAATQILLGQAPQALARLIDAFRLSAGEAAFLATAPRGYALVRTGTSRTALATVTTPAEDPFLHTGV